MLLSERASRVLVVDDDLAVATVLAALLSELGHEVRCAGSAEGALDALAEEPFDLLITDLRMPGMGGLALLRRARVVAPELPVIVLTAHGTVAVAVEAMQLGAADFLSKPFDEAEIAFVVPKALGTFRRAPAALDAMRSAGQGEPDDFWGSSPRMREVASRVRKAARGCAPVLLRGETGVGKELVAHAIHRASTRRDKPLIVVHCGAYPESLLEAELFGYEKGAFTGATAAKPGRFELADGGSLFLDEVGEITPAVQVKLLRVVVDGVVERLGSTRSRKLDVRWIAATHRPMEQMLRDGRFREDLFYRLEVLPIEVPPLRERAEDVDRLAPMFWRRECESYGVAGGVIAPDALALLRAQPWPGNVRQLENFLRRLAALSDDYALTLAEVERELTPRPGSISALGASGLSTVEGASLDRARSSAERAALLEAHESTQGNRKRMAAALNVSLRKLYYLLREHGVG